MLWCFGLVVQVVGWPGVGGGGGERRVGWVDGILDLTCQAGHPVAAPGNLIIELTLKFRKYYTCHHQVSALTGALPLPILFFFFFPRLAAIAIRRARAFLGSCMPRRFTLRVT